MPNCFQLCALALLCLIIATGNFLGADEAETFYEPVVQSVEGWTIKVAPDLLKPENKEIYDSSIKALANHLQRVKFILAAEKTTELQKLPLWLDLDHPLDNLQYHPNPAWLKTHGYDPTLANHVHIPRARQLLDSRQWAKHPYAIMHELAHAYHDQVLGFNDPEIMAAFEQAKNNKSYEKVLAHDHREVRHYALSNHKEYFAESTEAYLGVNDFYPFVRAELKEHDPRMFALLEKIWGVIR